MTIDADEQGEDKWIGIPLTSLSPEISCKCGCGFEISGQDGDQIQSILSSHQCYYSPNWESLPDPWHVSLSRLLTNLGGWSAIAFILYTLVDRLLEP